MTPARALGPGLLSAALVLGSLAVLGTPADAADPAGQALTRLDADADGALTIRRDGSGDVGFVGVPARAEVDNPAVSSKSKVSAAADAHLKRYGAAFGAAESGTTLARTDVQETVTGDVVRYQQRVDGVPVLGGQVVVSVGADRELSSILAETSDATSVADATVSEAAALDAARATFVKRNGPGDLSVESDGRWLLDAGLIGGDPAQADRTVWRIYVSRGVDQRRQILVDDRTGGIVMDINEIETINRVVCNDNNTPRNKNLNPPACAGPTYARSEGGPAVGNVDVDSAYDLAEPVSDLYAELGVDLTDLIGRTVSGGAKALAQTVNFCPTATPLPPSCPGYANAFWNGSQMYYGAGYAGADDVVGHEMTHGVTERTSNLFYWGQSGAINESISDIIGEIVDHRHPSAGDSATSWSMGEDIPGYPNGIRNAQDPTQSLYAGDLGDPDKTTSPFYVQDSYTYPDNDGVHTNSGVGNKTFYLISQGGSFNGQTMTGIDSGDAGLTKSARLWLLVDQTLTSGSDYADQAAVLDQSCQALLAAGSAGFTAADCGDVHKATVATELRQTPTNNPQPADAEAVCPTGVKRVLFDSETGDAASKLVAAPGSWTRGPDLARSGPDSWSVGDPSSVRTLPLAMSAGVALPAGQPSYLHFQQWRVLDWEPDHFYDVGTVEVDPGSGAAADAAGLPWVNGPTDVIDKSFGNLSTSTVGFGGDSRGFLASRADLSSYAGKTVKAQFTLSTDQSVGRVGWALDDITVYTCDVVVTNSALPTISGTPRVDAPLTAAPGVWTPTGEVAFAFQWLRNGAPIPGATATTYTPTATDVGAALAIQVTGTRPGSNPSIAVSAPTAAVLAGTPPTGTLLRGKPTIKGKARVGSVLAAKAGTWGPAGVAVTLQWLRNGKPIKKATKAKYKLVKADKGKKISIRVTGRKAGYFTTTATSKATGKVKAKPKKRR